MSEPRIRPLALCVFQHRGRILVNRAYDSFKDQWFYRPLGGGIEFGESSAQAVVREIREEIGAEVVNLRLLGTLENIFTYLGAPGHEIVQVYDGDLVDRTLYEREAIPGVESNGTAFQAVWRDVASFCAEAPVYPSGLLELLRSAGR